MPEFNTPADIANRALDHVGAEPITALTDNNKRARRVNAVYGKLRQAELRRNPWEFSISQAGLRPIDTTTMLLAAAMWVSTTTYFVGSLASDVNGGVWISRIPNNLGNDPTTSSAWEPYYGPLTVQPWASTSAYATGELVYTTAGDGTSRVYLSLISNNSDNPATATAWDATVTYKKNDVVTRSAVTYMSLIDLNLNQDPATAAFALWSASTTYAAGNKVSGSDGVIYQSIGSSNIGHDPTSTTGFWTNTGVLNPWTTVFTGGTGSISWRQIGGAEFPMGVGLVTPNIIYPIGAGPLSQSATLNVYRLPAAFLREAPQDPKAGSSPFLGAEWGRAYDDWRYERGYLVTAETGLLIYRFIADVTDVSRMDPMFCEGLACRIAREVCEPLTQSTSKHQMIDGIYKSVMTEARTANAILVGPEELPIDDWIAARA